MLHFLYVAISLIVGAAAALEANEDGKPAFIVVVAFLVYGMFWLPLLIGKTVARQLL
jgi:hypothetical protein